MTEWQLAHMQALEQLVHVLQNVLDVGKMTLKEDDLRGVIEGIGRTLESALLMAGVQRIEPAVGSGADPEYHQEESGAPAEAGKRIVELMRPGFMLRRYLGEEKVERVFRRAVVRTEEGGGDLPASRPAAATGER